MDRPVGLVTQVLPRILVGSRAGAQDRVLFATDFPLITPEKWLAAFDKLPIPAESATQDLKHNAVRLLGLA